MRALATIAALLLAALQVLVGLVMLGSASSVVMGVIVLGAGTLTLAGATVTMAARSASTKGSALVAVGQLVVCALLVVLLWDQWTDSRALGVDGLVVGFLGVALLGSACVAFATTLAGSPASGQLAGLLLTGAFVVGGVWVTAAAAADTVSRIGCGRFHFDRDRWIESDALDQMQMGRTIVKCGTLDGRSRAEVRAMLGRVMSGAGNTELAGNLQITYDRAGHVSDVFDATD
jgi:hypothetical protein